MSAMFPKDILIVDFEASGVNYPDMLPTQIGAILLDRKTFKEKKSYLSNIRLDFKLVTKEARKISGLTEKDLKNAPTMKKVGREFYKKFGTNVFLCSWVQHMDHRVLEKILNESKLDVNKYDYHYFDLWPVAYLYLLKQGYSGSPKSEAMFTAMGLPARGCHNALEDCRYAAEILRKLVISI